MERLFEKFNQKLSRVPMEFKRYLGSKIDWNSRLIGIKGARGAGKTTLLLQYAKENLPMGKQTLYVSLDDLYFTTENIVNFVDNFVKQGGKFLLLDEVHGYSNWSKEIKYIHDDQPDLKIIFTGCSMLHLDKAKGDLSRRAIMYELPGLSYREYLNYIGKGDFKAVSYDDILTSHTSIAIEITKQLRPLEHFQDYLRHG